MYCYIQFVSLCSSSLCSVCEHSVSLLELVLTILPPLQTQVNHFNICFCVEAFYIWTVKIVHNEAFFNTFIMTT